MSGSPAVIMYSMPHSLDPRRILKNPLPPHFLPHVFDAIQYGFSVFSSTPHPTILIECIPTGAAEDLCAYTPFL